MIVEEWIHVRLSELLNILLILTHCLWRFRYEQINSKEGHTEANLGSFQNIYDQEQSFADFLQTGVLKKFANFTEKHLCWSLYVIKLLCITIFAEKLHVMFSRVLNTLLGPLIPLQWQNLLILQ